MAHMVTVTIAGGSLMGSASDTKVSINADNISRIEEKQDPDDVGNSVIIMTDKNRLHVQETRGALDKLINGK
jgi:hypothetical protein